MIDSLVTWEKLSKHNPTFDKDNKLNFNIIKDPIFLQNTHYAFLNDLNKYINECFFSKYDLFFSIISLKIPLFKHASRIISLFQNFQLNIQNQMYNTINVQIEPYAGNNIYVFKMMNYLNENLRNDLYGAYVHGSLGTYEEIPYSDFDALVILKNEIFKDPIRLTRVALKLNRAKSIMYDFDPLQHHGWFVLTETHLQFYPDYFFPVELFSFAKSLFRDKGLVLDLKIHSSLDKNRENFYKLCESVLRKLDNKNYPKNIYQLKLLLSQFMLLPTLYLQARDGRGIYKKFSFELAKSDFFDADWAIMDDISDLRENWHNDISPLKRFIIKKSNPFFRYLAIKQVPNIHYRAENSLLNELYPKMIDLVIKMKNI